MNTKEVSGNIKQSVSYESLRYIRNSIRGEGNANAANIYQMESFAGDSKRFCALLSKVNHHDNFGLAQTLIYLH